MILNGQLPLVRPSRFPRVRVHFDTRLIGLIWGNTLKPAAAAPAEHASVKASAVEKRSPGEGMRTRGCGEGSEVWASGEGGLDWEGERALWQDQQLALALLGTCKPATHLLPSCLLRYPAVFDLDAP